MTEKKVQGKEQSEEGDSSIGGAPKKGEEKALEEKNSGDKEILTEDEEQKREDQFEIKLESTVISESTEQSQLEPPGDSSKAPFSLSTNEEPIAKLLTANNFLRWRWT